MDLAQRIHEVRLERYGQHGGPLLAEAVGVSFRNWIRYESGEARIPSPVFLMFIDVAGVCPRWLQDGEGEKYGPCRRCDGRHAGIAGIPSL